MTQCNFILLGSVGRGGRPMIDMPMVQFLTPTVLMWKCKTLNPMLLGVYQDCVSPPSGCCWRSLTRRRGTFAGSARWARTRPPTRSSSPATAPAACSSSTRTASRGGSAPRSTQVNATRHHIPPYPDTPHANLLFPSRHQPGVGHHL